MCGIVGYVGPRPPVPLIVDALRRLEYRGYDSAGVAVIENGHIESVRAPGKLAELERKLGNHPLAGRYGLGHTRWATHGRPSERNAHPILDSLHRVAVIHNGIIENFGELRAELRRNGWSFTSETDTEVVANLVSAELESAPGLLEAVRRATARLTGHYAFAAVTTLRGDDEIVVARNGPPLVIGLADGEQFLASDPAALVAHTRDVIFLENGDLARLGRERVEIWDRAGARVDRRAQRLSWDSTQVEKAGFRHFMLKEIHEQPLAVQATIAGRARFEDGAIDLGELGLDDDRLRRIERVHLVACGTSWHAALVGKFLIESLARVPVEVDYGSEYRYRDPLVGPGVLAIGISQSGETADTLSAMEAARERGALLACVCNVAGSQATRISDGVLLTHAGPEIGVASTKAFTTQLVALHLLALHLRWVRTGELDPAHVRALAQLPAAMERAVAEDARVARLAGRLAQARDVLYLGRGPNYPIALEGALKLKEISYVHAEGYPAGEMKHGPIALVDAKLPTIALATGNHTYGKMLGNLQEVRAREGRVLVVTDHPKEELAECGYDRLEVPTVDELLQPIVNVVPLQLLAYHVGVRRGADVDQPRNLAKSVTVE
jgi:glucosamine--fructose-6-phosphate aminotransferase (isomerizing)